jgi:hypothetical protein
MKSTFEVSRVFSDGTKTEPLIVPVTALPDDAQMGRRIFFRAGVTLSGVVAVLAGCGSPSRTDATASKPATDPPATPPSAASSEPGKAPDITPRVAKKAASPHPRKPRRRPKRADDPDSPYSAVPSDPSVPSYHPYGGYAGGGTRLGETIERPCTPEPVPPGYICTCNCVAQ